MKTLLTALFFFISFICFAQSPGGVSANLTFWLKADNGISHSGGMISGWRDQGPANLEVLPNATGARPTLTTDTINYYPSAFFNGSSPLLASIGSNYKTLVDATEGRNVNTTGSLFTVAHSGWDNGNIFSQFSNPICGAYVISVDLSSSVLNVGGRSRLRGSFRLTGNENTLLASALEAPGTNNSLHYLNGGDERVVTNAQTTVCRDNQVIRVGLDFRGSITEVITFDVKLTDEERRRVESYLAIKYGVTINSRGGGINGDYFTADGTTIWDASNGSTYQNRVVGIGRDDSSALYQRQSHDGGDNTRIYLQTLAPVNSANSGSFSSNGQFVMIADNDAPFSNNTGDTEFPSGFSIVNRISREWKVTNTDFTDSFSIDLKPAAGSYDASHIRLLIDEDGDFTSGATIYDPAVTYNAGVLTIPGITAAMIPANSTRYLAIVTVTSPGGVEGASFWIKANDAVYTDAGATPAIAGSLISQWNDISGNNNHLSQTATFEKPSFQSISPAFNYNPVVQFTDNYLISNTTDGLFTNGQTYNDIHIYTVHHDRGPASFDWLYYEGGIPSENRVSSSRDFTSGNKANYNITTSSSLVVSTITDIPAGTVNIVGHHAGTAGNYGQADNRYVALMVNGKEVSTLPSFPGYTVGTASPFYLGDNESGNGDNGNNPFTGDIGEVTVFLKPLTATERNQVESYLAIKYGKTLDNAAGGTDGNYLTSDGSIVWTAANGSAYHNDVIGIIRDNSSGLLQKQSHQSDDSTRLYIANLETANVLNTGVISQNLSAVMMGHNGGMLGQTDAANSDVPTGSLTNTRLEREWKVTNTSFNESFNIDIRLDSTGLGNISIDNLALLVDENGNFDNASIYSLSDGLSFTYDAGLLSIGGISNLMIPVNSTRYITVAKIAVTPGGVRGVRLWTKADAGVFNNFGTTAASDGEEVAQWNDFSGNNIHLFQSTPAERPVLLNGDTTTFNYNPVVKFTDNHLTTSLIDGLFTSGQTYSNIHIYTVHQDLDSNNFDWLYYEGDNTVTNRVSASFNFSSGPRADYDVAASRLQGFTSTDIVTGVTNIVGHHVSSDGNYGQANNRYGALMVNGKEANSLDAFSNYTPANTSEFYLGDNETGNGDAVNNPFTGYIGELLLYVSPLTAPQRDQIESYLAIKYGKTLDNSAGGTDGDYFSSTSSTIWDASDGSAYHNNVIALARDDNSALYQRQSHIASDSVRLYIGDLATVNRANSAAFGGDEQFIVTGDNNAPIANNSGNTEYPVNMGILNRMDREWKITNTNFSDSFSIDIKPAAGVYDTSKIRILIDDDGDFTNAALYSPPINYANGVLTLASLSTEMIPANSTRYLAVVTIASPGGIAPALWVKANEAVHTATGTPAADGEAVSRWADLSGSNNDLSETAPDRRPVFRNGSSNLFNYNPVLFFTSSHMVTTQGDGLFETGKLYSDVNTFTVHQDLNADDFNWLYHEGGPQNRVAAGYNFPGFATAFYNVSNQDAQEASTETDIPTNTVSIVGHHTGASGNYGQDNNKYKALMVNGKEIAGDNTAFSGYTANVTSEFNVGNTSDATEIFESPFAGYIGEIIVYKERLDMLQRNKIESYLAVKYGQTLDNSAGGTDGDYISSEATNIWDASLNSDYHKQVIGIGRDDNSALLQNQSHSDDDTTRIYISTLQATNKANSGAFTSDNSFLMAGNNGGQLFNTYGNDEFPQDRGIYSRIDREWKITNTRFNGSFSMDVKLNTTPVNAIDLRLLVDEDGDFRDATMYGSPDVSISYNSGIVTISGIPNSLLPADSTRYFSIASVNRSTPLPLRLLKFTADKSDRNTIWLNWKTDEEINFSHFEIERSVDGTQWEWLGNVQATNQPGVNNYRFEDRTPAQGINYYRLKMVDTDSTFKYSEVRIAGIFNRNKILVYPNPVLNEIIISGTAYQPANLRFYDMLGRDVRSQVTVKASGSNVIIIDASRLLSGVYLLQLEQETFRIIKK